MFVDAVLANVLLFALGQVFAWLYLRSGRFWVGAGSTLVLWVAIDWWLVARYVFAAPASGQRLPLLMLQVVAVATMVAYLWAHLRRRRGAAQRSERFREAIASMLAGKHEEAEAAYRQLVWVDPWDASAWIARGDAARRLGQDAAARRHYRRAAGVDVGKQFVDLLANRAELLIAEEPTLGKPAAIPIGPAPVGSKSAKGRRTSAASASTGS